jgi:Flp pilus assembly protein TadD
MSLGVSLETVGKLAEAEREYRTYLEMAPDGPDAEKVKAQIERLRAR